MRFLFVDKIDEKTDTYIKGRKSFPIDDPMQYKSRNGEMQVAPGVVSEAIGQLVSWLCIEKNNFSGRPVFLFADTIEVLKPIKPGCEVIIEGTIDDLQDDTFVFSGKGYVDGECVHSITRCSGYFMPLGDLEDPEVTRDRFNHLVGEGLVLEDDGQAYDFESLVDEVVAIEPGKSITTKKQMKMDEPFYKDHFPRFPVTPIVMINEMIGRATTRLLEEEGGKFVFPHKVEGVKIKNFVKPGETCEVSVSIKDRTSVDDHEVIQMIAEIKKEGKRILRGKYSYRVY